jgi:ribose 5-phosphate isomerase B
MMNIAIASDHAGFELKTQLIPFLKGKGYEVKDFGSFTPESVDYPDYAHPQAIAVENGTYTFGISICGSGNGVNMTVNKHQGIRSALCWNKEIAALARQHNDANICALPARFITNEQAKEIIDIFISTAFDGGRHEKRVQKIPCS